jgi:hypothetical protein
MMSGALRAAALDLCVLYVGCVCVCVCVCVVSVCVVWIQNVWGNLTHTKIFGCFGWSWHISICPILLCCVRYSTVRAGEGCRRRFS